MERVHLFVILALMAPAVLAVEFNIFPKGSEANCLAQKIAVLLEKSYLFYL